MDTLLNFDASAQEQEIVMAENTNAAEVVSAVLPKQYCVIALDKKKINRIH